MENSTNNEDLKMSIDFTSGEVIDSASGQVEEQVVEETKVEEPVQQEETKHEEQVETSDETIEALPTWAQERLKKLEEEKDNYKKGMLKYYKKKTLEPEVEKSEETIEDYPEWDEQSKKFQKQTLSEAEKIAERKASEIIQRTNERTAISTFISEHPELEDDGKWSEVVANYTPKNGKESITDIVKDLERAYVITRYERGEDLKPEKKKVTPDKQVAKMASVSSDISKASSKQGQSLSESALRLASRMKVDPKKLAKEDDSLSAEINF